MFPGGMNPKQMKQMMSRMGIKSDEIQADRVIIEGTARIFVPGSPVQVAEPAPAGAPAAPAAAK